MGAEVKVPSLSFYLQYKVLTHRLCLCLSAAMSGLVVPPM